MSELGDKLIRGLRELRDGLRNGRPFKQSAVRRMKVKGKTVHVRETFAAPIRATHGEGSEGR